MFIRCSKYKSYFRIIMSAVNLLSVGLSVPHNTNFLATCTILHIAALISHFLIYRPFIVRSFMRYLRKYFSFTRWFELCSAPCIAHTLMEMYICMYIRQRRKYLMARSNFTEYSCCWRFTVNKTERYHLISLR